VIVRKSKERSDSAVCPNSRGVFRLKILLWSEFMKQPNKPETINSQQLHAVLCRGQRLVVGKKCDDEENPLKYRQRLLFVQPSMTSRRERTLPRSHSTR
jgi:hypothetical protein